MILATALSVLLTVTTGAALPDADVRGTITIQRSTVSNGPVAGAEYSVARLTHDRHGNEIDLATKLGWGHAASVTVNEASALPSDGHRYGSTGADGTLTFSSLDLGLWLVTETYAPAGHTLAAPFLVTLPFTSPTGDKWLHHATVYPKAGIDHSRISVETAYAAWVGPGIGNYEDPRNDRERHAGSPAAAVTLDSEVFVRSRVTNVGHTSLAVGVATYTHLGAVELYNQFWFYDGRRLWVDDNGYLFHDSDLIVPVVLAPGRYVLGCATHPVPAPGALTGTTVRARGTAVAQTPLVLRAMAYEPVQTRVSDVDAFYALGGARSVPTPPATATPERLPDLPVTGVEILAMTLAATALVGAGLIAVIARRKKQETTDA